VELAFRDQVIESGLGIGKSVMEAPFSVLLGFIEHGGPVRRGRFVTAILFAVVISLRDRAVISV